MFEDYENYCRFLNFQIQKNTCDRIHAHARYEMLRMHIRYAKNRVGLIIYRLNACIQGLAIDWALFHHFRFALWSEVDQADFVYSLFSKSKAGSIDVYTALLLFWSETI